MATFDTKNLNFVTPEYAASKIQSGWIAQYRGSSWISNWIRYATGGVHSHSAMLRREGELIDVLEFREGKGGRAIPFFGECRKESGMIDIFSVNLEAFPHFDGNGAALVMREMTSRDYGYRGIVRMLLQKIPFIRRLYALDMNDEQLLTGDDAPFCSHGVCSAARIGGKQDPVPRKPDSHVSPNDLTWSLLYNYEFTVSVSCDQCPEKTSTK